MVPCRTQRSLFEAIDHSALPFQHLVSDMRQRQEIDGTQRPLQAFFQHVVEGQFDLPGKAAAGVLQHFDFKPNPTPAKFEAGSVFQISLWDYLQLSCREVGKVDLGLR